MASPPPSPSIASRWALARTLGDAGHRVVIGLRELPAENLRAWAMIIVIGWVACAVFSVVVANVARSFADRGLNAWDERTLLAVEARGPLSFNDAILAESPGNLSYLVPVTLAVAILAALRRRPILGMTVVASYVLARFLVLAGWQTWNRARPQLIAEGIAAPPLHSFPSGHAVLSLAVWGLLAWLWMAASRSWIERMIVALLLVFWITLVGTARVRLGSHWPSDIIGGAIVGTAWLVVVIFALRRGERGLDARPKL